MGGSSQMSAPESTGQLGPFSSLGQDPTNSMRMGGNMLTSTPPTGAGTMQSLVGTMPPGVGPSTGANGGMVIGSAPGPGQNMSSQVGPPTPSSGSPFHLFGGGEQQSGSQFFQELINMLRGNE